MQTGKDEDGTGCEGVAVAVLVAALSLAYARFIQLSEEQDRPGADRDGSRRRHSKIVRWCTPSGYVLAISSWKAASPSRGAAGSGASYAGWRALEDRD